MAKAKVGVVGFGVVGRAVTKGFQTVADIKIYDIKEELDSLEETVNESDIIFVCVPTPSKESGKQDPLHVMKAILYVCSTAKDPKNIVLKSTVTPGTTRMLAKVHEEHNFIFNPEFISERNSFIDFINLPRVVLGGDKVEEIEELYKLRFPHTQTYKTSWEAAEIVKYMENCFFAVKVSFMNEFFDVAERYGIQYNELRDMFVSGGFVANSHVDVPGHDCYRGYGGACLPKDTDAWVSFCEDQGLPVELCKAAQGVNKRVRP